MKKTLKKSFFYVAVILITVFMVLVFQNIIAQTYVPITNYHNGIDIGIQGTEGVNYVFDRYYYDPLINDVGLCYIKSDVPITLAHNANNSRIYKTSTVIQGDDQGIIRYRVDQDYQKVVFWAGDDGPWSWGCQVYPAYTGPVSFDNMTYPTTGESVVGNIGLSTTDFSDRDNLFSKGMLDAAGNEYHYLSYADDDDHSQMFGYQLESCASDGKSMLFCVNPKTPAIWLNATSSGAEYYTTPAKTYWIPKIHEQISYVTEYVDIQLKNIMNANPVYYRIDGGSYQQYTGAISSNTLSNGQHTLEFYYDAAYVQTRVIVKNPDHPCKNDVFEDGTGHGYLLWKDEAEFQRARDRSLTGDFTSEYQTYKDRCDEYITITGNNGIRNLSMGDEPSLTYAMVALFEGISDNLNYMEAAKARLLNSSRMHIENIGWEVNWSNGPNPCHEITYRGYVDDRGLFANAFAYDLIAKHYRSDQHVNGITPIQDLRIRDMLAVPVMEGLMVLGGYHRTYDLEIEMWSIAQANAAVVAALAMPAYNTNYLGTSGFDGTQASYTNTPYPDYPVSWKEAYLLYTDRDNPTHTSQLHGFPNKETLFNWFDGTMDYGLIRADGQWHDRAPYSDYAMMGHGIEYFYNVMRRKFNKTYPKLDLFIQHSVNGTLEGHKFTTDSDYGPRYVDRRCMGNEYFPDYAQAAIDNVVSDKYFFSMRPNHLVYHNPDWASVTVCESSTAPTVPTNLNGVPSQFTVDLNWTASTHAECGVMAYNVLRDGNHIATVMGTQFTDAGLSPGTTYEYSIVAISQASVQSVGSTPLQVTTLTDDILPTMASVSTTVYNTEVLVEFSEDMDPVTAENISYYSIDNGITVSAAQLQADNITVSLTVSLLSSGINYTLTVNNVEDAYGGNAITPNSTTLFSATENPTGNLALQKTVYASSNQNSNYLPEFAVDGNKNTRWASEKNDPQWIYVDLGLEYSINQVLLNWETAYGKAYEIQVSNDATNWTSIYSTSTGDGGIDDITNLNGSGRYVRLYGSARGTYYGYSLYEFEIYGSLGATNVPVTGVNLDQTSLPVNVGQTSQLTASIDPSNATNRKVTWSISDAGVATVDANGVVSALSSGQAIISVKTEDGGYTSNCTVNVNEVIPVDVTGVNLNQASLPLYIGQSSQLTETIAPSNATNQNVQWSSDNTSVVTVDANGVVSALSSGQAIITVTTEDGEYTATCIVTVAENTSENIALNKTAFASSVESGSSHIAPNAIDGSGSSRWASEMSDPQWIYVDLGQSYHINRVVLDWQTAYGEAYEIQVSDDAANWSVIYSTATGDGGTDDIALNGSGRYIRMFGTERGTVWGYSLYEFEVYGTIAQGGTPVTGVTLSDASLSLNNGETATLTVTIIPSDATNQSVTWLTSDSSIATVDANGMVSAVAAGSAIITVTTNEGGHTDNCTVSVNQVIISVTGAILSQTTLDLSTTDSETPATPVFYWDMETENATIYKPGSDSVPQKGSGNALRTNTSSFDGDWSVSTQGPWSSITFDNNSNEDAWAPVTEGTIEFYWQYHEPWGDLMLFQMTGKSSTKDPLYDTNDGISLRTRGNDPGEFFVGSGSPRNLWEPIELIDGQWYRFRIRYKDDIGISMQIDDGPVYYSDATTWGPTKCLAWHQILIGNDRSSQTSQNIDNFAVYDHWVDYENGGTTPATHNLTETIIPSNATDQTVTWISSNTNIATVDANGVVTPVATGTCTITVTTNDGGYTADCVVNVNGGGGTTVDISGVSLDQTNLNLNVGQTSLLTASVEPSNATNQNITWSSDNTSVATVDANGLITLLSAGYVTITATTYNGSFTANCSVTVNSDDITTGTDQKSISDQWAINIFPNPITKDYFTIDINGYSTDKALNLKIYDVTGKMVYSLNNINTHQTKIPCNLSKGVYIINIDNGTSSIREKLIVR